jgi:phage N-6-adenine-methyltransferase
LSTKAFWTDIHASSAKTTYATPQRTYDELNERFHFTLDVCSDGANAKCENFFTEDEDALAQDWGSNVCFMNPPYGRGLTLTWMKKAYEASCAGATVVCLVPSRTDTKWFHDYALKGEVEFLRGRLTFGDMVDPAPFPSVVVIFLPATS